MPFNAVEQCVRQARADMERARDALDEASDELDQMQFEVAQMARQIMTRAEADLATWIRKVSEGEV